MKRVIEGRTYNTDTATMVATYEHEDEKGNDVEGKLFITPGGAFFLLHSWNVDGREKHHMEQMSREEVQRLIERGDNIEIIDDEALQAPPEAAGEAEPGATIYIRVPASLKRRVDESSKAEKVSGNVWAMRCVEKCLDPPTRELAILWAILKPLVNSREGQLISHPQKDDAFKEVSTWIIALANKVAGPMTIEEIEGKHEGDERVKQMRARFAPR